MHFLTYARLERGGGGESPCLPRIEMYLRQSASAGLIYTDKIGPRGLVE